MIYGKIHLHFQECEEEIRKLEEKDFVEMGTKLNRLFEKMKYNEASVVAYVTELSADESVLIFAKRLEDSMELVYQEIENKLEQVLSGAVTLKQMKEITVEEFRNGIQDSYNKGYIRNHRNVVNDLKIDFQNNRCFHVKESILPEETLSKDEALKCAEAFMAGEEYRKELERIYCENNVKEFYVHPVHYHVMAESESSAEAMTDLLLKALHSNGRLSGRRISYIKDVTQGCYDESDFDNLICNSQGATIVLSMNTNKNTSMDVSDGYDEVVEYIGEHVATYHKNVLFIFQEIINKNSIGKKLVSSIKKTIRVIDLEEGLGEKALAEAFLRQLIQKSEYVKFLDVDTELQIPEQENYSLSQIYGFYEEWMQRTLYEKIYQSYGYKKKVVVEEKVVESSAYEELNQMVGLENVKDLIEQIVAMNKIKQKRQQMGLSVQQGALHMVFTGNPGSAKTTVARLLTRILQEEGIIKNKKIVECGRGDLVGKYVGWTAKQVKSKFREAAHGVLFIDEAYALVDDRNGSFGDEAINTIVQEMENHREDVIVIFAGYPDKMQRFLERNEGLRSRITFHVDFPNYNREELLDIMKYMINQKGYSCEAAAYEKWLKIFSEICSNQNFGNGRYVRNLVEHAILKQSNRLMKEFKGEEVDEKCINVLKAEDFETIVSLKEQSKVCMGFQAE